MSTQATLNAEPRQGIRKGANRKLRVTGRVPAVLYGKDQEPVLLSVDAREAERLFQQISVENTIIDLRVKGGDGSKIQALVREVQVGAVRPDLVHIDFYKIQAGVKLEVEIPIELIGIPNGVRQEGGILEQIVHEVPVRCLPDQIPESFQIEVTGMNLMDSLHIGDLKVAEGIEILMDADRTLCIVSVPRAVLEAAAAPGEAPVTEVIGEKKDEGEEAPAAEKKAGGDKK